MHNVYPWMKPEGTGSHRVGLVSSGAIDEKIPFILYALLLSADLNLNLYQNYPFPLSDSAAFIEETESILLNSQRSAVVFDLRVQDWTDTNHMEQSRRLALSLQDICSHHRISSSVILASGSQQLGNCLGFPFEISEAKEVLEGKGPPDLLKFALEIGSDFLLLTKKVRHKMEANIFLKEKILSGDTSSRLPEIFKTCIPCLETKIKKRVYSPKEGYLHHWVPEALLHLKHKFLSFLPGSGFFFLKKHRDKVRRGDEIAQVQISKDQQLFLPDEFFDKTFVISQESPDFQPFILDKTELRFI